MIDFHYWPTPNGWKVSILLEELGVPYRPIMVDIGKGAQFTPEFMAISPNHRMPAIVDHDVDGDPVPVFESGAIMLYLADKHGRFMPAGAQGRKELLEWLFWQVGNLGAGWRAVQHFVNMRRRGGLLPPALQQRVPPLPGCPGTAPGSARLDPRRRLHHRRHDLLAVGAHRQSHWAAPRRVPERDALAGRGEGSAGGAKGCGSRQGVPAFGAAHRGRAQGAVRPDRAHRRRAGIGTSACGTVARRTEFRPRTDSGVRADDAHRMDSR